MLEGERVRGYFCLVSLGLTPQLSRPSMPVMISVLYFAALRDLSGVAEERVVIDEPVGNVEQLLRVLQTRHAALSGRLDSVRVAVNEEFVELSTALSGGEVVALIPPVSGG